MSDISPIRPAQSDRVLTLAAACIRVAVRRRFGHELSTPDAVDLARRHDIRSALKSIAEKMDVHSNRPDKERFELAVTETKLTDLVTSDETLEHIMKVRQASAPVMCQEAAVQREQLIKHLRQVRRESSQWVDEYRHFLRRLGTLSGKTRRELLDMPLPIQMRSDALSKLEGILLRAVEQASRL